MICKKEIEHELSRLPKLLKIAVLDNDWRECIELETMKYILEWILTDECTCKKGQIK